MNLLTTKKFELLTETGVLIKDLNFSLSAGEKIALIGRNGSGKSSFLNIINYLINNREKQDHLSWNGEISVNPKLKCYYLSQEIKLSFDGSVDEFLDLKLSKESNIYNEYYGLLSRSSSDKSSDFEKRLDYLSGEMENRNLWNFPEKKNEILENFKFTTQDRLRNLSELSGGEVVRLALTAIMLVNPDLILLDEPTNNLDSHQIEYLKDFILKSKAGILIVSHDRYFLDAVINKIIEIDEYSHEAKIYGGNYSFYKQQKILAHDVQERLYEDQNKKRNRLGRSITILNDRSQLYEGISTNSFMRVRAAKLARAAKVQAKRLDRELNTIKLPKLTQKTVFTLGQADKDNKKINILSFKNLDFAYNQNTPLFNNLNLDVYTGDRVAIVGKNGSGKSTLMKLLAGEMEVTRGQVHCVESKFYLPQEIIVKNPKQTVLDYLCKESNMSEAELGKVLGKVLFVNPKNLRLGDVSQGQLKRILITVMLLIPNAVLFLDEPTNHLDLPTMESFEFSLKEYPGAIIVISHDKYFLDSLKINKEIFLGDKSHVKQFK